MKILMVMLDMVSARLLSTYRPYLQPPNALDEFFDSLGGTHFVNCYSLAPDTARFWAVLQTGLPPDRNGCNHLKAWPVFFLEKNLITLFDILAQLDIPTIIHTSRYNSPEWIIKNRIAPENLYLDDYAGFIAAIRDWTRSDSFLSLCLLDDFHWTLDDLGLNSQSFDFGLKKVRNALNSLWQNLDPDDFDRIYIFSDHGFISPQTRPLGGVPFLLDEDRIAILMAVRKRGETTLTKRMELCSNLDLLPTILDDLREGGYDPPAIDLPGFSLHGAIPDRTLFFEDHYYLEQLPLWAVRTAEYFYQRDLYHAAIIQRHPDGGCSQIADCPPRKDIDQMLEEQFPKFKDYCYRANVNRVDESLLNLVKPTEFYRDGSPRTKTIAATDENCPKPSPLKQWIIGIPVIGYAARIIVGWLKIPFHLDRVHLKFSQFQARLEDLEKKILKQ
ncbi:MAG: hypothetical protein HQK55_00250 [Deltaproteobacteria bacterium]|nr:hypothetical protein [Deltaproteobacteria bacterium]